MYAELRVSQNRNFLFGKKTSLNHDQTTIQVNYFCFRNAEPLCSHVSLLQQEQCVTPRHFCEITITKSRFAHQDLEPHWRLWAVSHRLQHCQDFTLRFDQIFKYKQSVPQTVIWISIKTKRVCLRSTDNLSTRNSRWEPRETSWCRIWAIFTGITFPL